MERSNDIAGMDYIANITKKQSLFLVARKMVVDENAMRRSKALKERERDKI